MRPILFVVLLLTGFCVKSQTMDSFGGKYQYYLFINGLQSKDDVISVEEIVRKKPGVKLFISDRFPVRFFLLKTDIAISRDEFQKWIGKEHSLEVFGLGIEYKEAAIMAGLRSHHK